MFDLPFGKLDENELKNNYFKSKRLSRHVLEIERAKRRNLETIIIKIFSYHVFKSKLFLTSNKKLLY